jgi:K+-transporting ATPase KdpF subunit
MLINSEVILYPENFKQMRLKKLKPELYLLVVPIAVTVPGDADNNKVSYIIGGVIAVFILAYLLYSLLKPDKF